MTEFIRKQYSAHRDVILYIFWGGVTTLVSYAAYFASRYALTAATGRPDKDNLILTAATAVSWILAVSVAFVTNKLFVFESRSWRRSALARELPPFFAARALSYFIDEGLTILCIGILGWNEPLVKIMNNVIIVAFNYIASKFVIFRKIG
ncbi:MAG: GtrA family protein [Clostridiales bacterium]|jgi:putative flippase GtrA|nr:GtrA family protein [Clostridiales bacterium]